MLRANGLRPTLWRAVIAGAVAVALASGATAPPGPATPTARPRPADEMDRYMRKAVREREFSGAVIVARRGRILFSRGYGYADRAAGRRNTTRTLFRVPGMFVFNTVAAYQLRDRGRLELDESVCAYVPRCPSRWRQISISALLEARSGLPSLWRLRAARARSPTISEAVGWMKQQPLRFVAGRGRGFDDSPAPQVLLSYIIGRVSGVGWLGYLQRSVFRPAGMRDTGVRPAQDRRAVGYLLPDLRPGRDVEFTRPDPGHGLWTTVGDLLRFDQALYRGVLLAPQTREALFPSASHTVQGTHGYDRVQGRVRDGWFSIFGHHAPDRIFVGLLMNGRKAQYRFYDIELALAGIAARGGGRPAGPVELPPPPVIAFSGELGAITLATADGTGRVALNRPYAGYALPVAWSRDGKRLLFYRWSSGRPETFVIDATGLNERRVANGQPLAWMPDGRIAVVASGAVWLITPNGRSRQRATAPGVREARSALAVSPDGRRVVWTRIRRLGGASTRSELLLSDLETRVTRRLRAEPGFYLISASAWAPDGTAIAFTRRDRLGSFHGGTYITDAEGRTLRRVVADAGSGPTWSSDGKKLAYNVGISCKIRIVDVASRSGVTLPFEGCSPIWRPD